MNTQAPKTSFYDTVAKPLIEAVHGIPARPTPLLDTREAYDARLCGYDAPCDPIEDGEGCIISFTPGKVPSVFINTANGELVGVSEIKAARDALNAALKLVGA